MNTITQKEIDNLPQPPQEWLDDIEKNRLNDVINDVPNEIWFMIGDFKRAAEKRDNKNNINRREVAKKIHQDYKNDTNYLEYDNIFNKIKQHPITRPRIRKSFQEMIIGGNCNSFRHGFMGRLKNAIDTWEGVSKSYFKMTPSVFIDNVLKRKTKLNDINIRFFNHVVKILIKEYQKRGWQGAYPSSEKKLFEDTLCPPNSVRDENIIINEMKRIDEIVNKTFVCWAVEDF